MTAPLTHIVEPQTLLLVWQTTDESDSQNRTRRVVGEVTRTQGATAKLRYLLGTPDFQAASAQGFQGYPGFSINNAEYATDAVMEALMRRLPPRKREDFADYLAMHRLPNPFGLSDFALLGYTGALLPSDGFSIVPVFDPNDSPCEYILEVAGARYYSEHLDTVTLGDAVELHVELDNAVEPGAVAILHNGRKLGFVNRALLPTVSQWLNTKTVHATVERKNGKPTRPLVCIRLLIE